MLKLSKKVEYGLISLLHMDSLDGDRLATTKEIAEQYRIPSELLGKVLQSLAKTNLVESVHGARGGYRLTRPLEEATLGDVVQAMEGPLQLARCQEDPDACEQFCACNIREPVLRIQAQLNAFINRIRLSAFRESARVEDVLMEIK
jgi:Rrf2 family protein